MVSVIIPTLNAGVYLGELLTRLKAQTMPCEVVIIDSSSTDASVQIAKSHGIEPMRTTARAFNHGRTRNLAAEKAVNDTLVFLSQDALPLDDCCIENLVRPLREREIAACYGRHVARPDASPTERFAREFNYPEAPCAKSLSSLPNLGIKTFFFSNVCSAVRRKEFEEVGGFPDDVLMYEDMLFAARLLEKGYKILYVPEAAVLHSHHYGLREQFKRYFRAGASFKKHQWFLEYSRGRREGIEFLRNEMEYLARFRMYMWIPYAVLEAVAKYSGYELGLSFGAVDDDQS